MDTLHYAPDAWRLLNGFFCIFKPAGLPLIHVRKTLAFNICRDLNEMEKRPPKQFVRLKGSVTSGKPFEIELSTNYADHELVVGPRYQEQDIRLRSLSFLGKNTSGVLVMAINDGCKKVTNVNFLKKYEIKGQFGLATNTFMPDGKIMEKSSFAHIRQSALDRLLASIQASHQTLAYDYAGVDIQSQEAYELASKGIIRPKEKSNPIIYSIKCIDLNLPYFSLEMYCINETELYLTQLIHQIGVYLRSCAVCTHLRCKQYGCFMLDNALLRKHWTLENILNNIALSKKILNLENITPSSAHFESIKSSQLKTFIEDMQNDARNYML